MPSDKRNDEKSKPLIYLLPLSLSFVRSRRKMAEAIVSSVVRRLGELLLQKVIFLHGVSDQVDQLQDELKRIQCLLKDADARQNEGDGIHQWLADIRETAYDAEDIIESYALKVASQRGGGIQNVLKRFACILYEGKTTIQIGSKIANITTKISNLKNSLQSYGIKDYSRPSTETLREQRQTYAHIEHDVVGMEDNLNEVVAYLTEEKYSTTVSICGMGGIGKTTLARKVYHHQKVKSQFHCCAWAYISQQCQRRNVWEGVLISLISPSKEQRDEIRSLRDEELAEKLCEIQQRKKCLVVLDDIWSIDAWDSIRAAFPRNDTDSKILITSRNKIVALHVDPRGHLRELQCLDDEKSWELLQMLAISWREDCRIKEYMKILGKEMARCCKGLPLAITVLGGLLATKQTIEEWSQVHVHVKSYLHEQEGLRVSEVLALSYNDLPCHLKQCFLYLGHFPEDYEIRTKGLIQMWVAESLIHQMQHIGGNEETLEDVGERYLQELVQRCIVQVGQRSSIARIKTCRLHDHMRDFCVTKAKLENFLHVISINRESMEEIEAPIGKVRRVATSGESINPVTLEINFPSASQQYFHLRSLLIFSSNFYRSEKERLFVPLYKTSMLRNFKYLRVLNFVNFTTNNYGGVDFPREIGSLIHLRFLSLRNTGVRNIQPLRNLKCLLTLDLRSVYLRVSVPNYMLRNMENLRHLYLPRYSEVSGKLQLPNVSKLQTLVNVPVFICDVKDLVAGFDEFGKNSTPSNFTFNCLGVLKIENRTNNTVDIIPMITCCPCIYKLRLIGEIEKLPEYDRISPYLAHLTMIFTRLEEDPMATLEKFPNLKILRLYSNAYEGRKMVCSVRGFPQLQSLILANIDNLEEWEVEEGSMPNLCHLEIAGCDNLRTVPDGFQFITTLQKLEIVDMPESFAYRVGKGGQDFYKIRHVPSLEFKDYTPSVSRALLELRFAADEMKNARVWRSS